MFEHLATSANKISLMKWKKVADYGDHVIDIPHNFNMHAQNISCEILWAEHWCNLRRSKEGQRPQATMLNIVNAWW